VEARRRHRQGQADQRLSRRPRGGEYGKAGRHQTQQRGVTSRKMVENPSDFLWSRWHGLVLT
jgi:hypothetical protein